MFRVFQIAVRGGWENPPSGGLESEILLGAGVFLTGEGNLRKIAFDN